MTDILEITELCALYDQITDTGKKKMTDMAEKLLTAQMVMKDKIISSTENSTMLNWRKT